MSRLCAFDVDGTLRDEREGSLMTTALRYGAEIGFIDPVRCSDALSPGASETEIAAALAGVALSNFNAFIQHLSETAPEETFPWARQIINEERAAGSGIIVVSQSASFLVRAYAAGLDIGLALGSHYHMTNQTFTGQVTLLNKGAAVATYNRGEQLKLAAGNGMSDVAVLEQAKRAIVVNPGAELGRLALARGWEIIRADQPQSSPSAKVRR